MTAKPQVSVVMPVRDAAPFVNSAIGDILSQTLQDLELVIFDDCSVDESPKIIERWMSRDQRVRYFRSDHPQGLAMSSQMAVLRARAEFVARMDADDRCAPTRLQEQTRVMAGDDSVGLVGCLSIGIDEHGRPVRPVDLARLEKRGPYPPFPHGSIMFRRSAFDAIGGYREGTDGFEDIDLFHRFAGRYAVLTISRPLYKYRYHRSTTTSTRSVENTDQLLDQMRSSIHLSGSTPLPDAWTTAAALNIWAGNRPPSRPRRIETHLGRFYGTVGYVSPRLARSTIAMLIRARNARRRFKRQDLAVPWQP